MFRRWLSRARHETELDAEIQAHLDLEAEERQDAGLTASDARLAARRAFGNVGVVREEVRDAWGWTTVERFLQDVRYAVRTVRRSPGFTLTAVLSLALGIGANTGIFSLSDALLFRPLAIREPWSLAVVRATTPERALDHVSFPDFKEFRDKTQAFDGLIAHDLTQVAVAKSADAVPQMRMGMKVSRDFFQVLGVRPALGRAFTADESEVAGRDHVVVLSHRFWVSEFNADPHIIGRTMQASQRTVTVIGVLPEAFTGMDPIIQPYLYVPMSLGERAGVASRLERRDAGGFIVRGRLRDGVTREHAQAELAALARTLAAQYPETNRHRGVAVRTEMQLRQEEAPALIPVVFLLLALSGLVLAIVCANVANLFLARARSRGHEVAIRLAIGSGQFRLMRQLLTESAVIAFAGCAAGLGVGVLVIRFLRSIRIPTDTPLVIAVQMDQRVLLFSLALACVSTLAFGLVPAWQAGRADLVDALKRRDGGAPRRRRMLGRQALVVGQIALSLVLLVAAGLMLDAFGKMLVLNPGFRTDHIMMMELDPSLAGYSPAQTQELYRQLRDRARELPGVRAATLARAIPFRPNFSDAMIVPEQYQLPRGQDGVRVPINTVEESYFDTMQIDILRGRAFTVDDRPDSQPTAIVNDTFARTYWPNQEPLNKRFRLGANGPWVTVVGIARTTKYTQIAEAPQPHIYLPIVQRHVTRMTLLVHTAGEPLAFADPLRQVIRSLDPQLAIFNVRSLDALYRDGALGVQRLVMQMVTTMGVMGLCLAVMGLYAVIAYGVSRRMREFGVRMSVGADRRDILRLVLHDGFTLAAAGSLVGLALAIPIHRSMSAALVGLGPLSAWTLVVVPIGLVLVTMAACLAPAWRASQVDPARVLRPE